MAISVSALLHAFYHRLGRNWTAVRAASLVRNQLDAVVRYHFADSFYDAEQMDERLLALIGPTVSKFVDVGANVGRWTLRLLRHSPQARGIALEPGSISNELKRNVSAFPAVTVRVVAAGAREGHATLFESPSATEGSTLVDGVQLSDSIQRSVPIVTIDAELSRLCWDSVDMIKVDAEGFDLDVLRGAEQTIQRRASRWIQFEYNVHWRMRGATLLAAERLLSGYELYVISPDGLHRANLERYGDYFAYSNYLAARNDSVGILGPLLRRPL